MYKYIDTMYDQADQIIQELLTIRPSTIAFLRRYIKAVRDKTLTQDQFETLIEIAEYHRRRQLSYNLQFRRPKKRKTL